MRFAPGGGVVGHSPISINAYHAHVDLLKSYEYFFTKYYDFGPGHPYVGPISFLFFLVGIFFLFKNWRITQWPIKCFFFFTISCVLLAFGSEIGALNVHYHLPFCLLYTSPSPRDQRGSRMPSSA